MPLALIRQVAPVCKAIASIKAQTRVQGRGYLVSPWLPPAALYLPPMIYYGA